MTTSKKPSEPPKGNFTEAGRLSTCLSIIHTSQQKIVDFRRAQFNNILFELRHLVELSLAVTKSKISM
jgi:hypothetical protein